MAWYPDLSTETDIACGEHVRAIGWLSSGHPFSTGESSPAFRARLATICRLWTEGLAPLRWCVCAGIHECELCKSFCASGNIGVPAGALLYVAPEMIHHYVEVHRYSPPPEFVAAVLASPLPGTPGYDAAVAAFPDPKMPGTRFFSI